MACWTIAHTHSAQLETYHMHLPPHLHGVAVGPVYMCTLGLHGVHNQRLVPPTPRSPADAA